MWVTRHPYGVMIISVNMSIKLKKSEYITMLDRLALVSTIIDNHLQQHSVSKIDTDIKNHITKAVDELYCAHRKIIKKI